MTAKSSIKVIPTPFQDVLAVLKSPALLRVEEAIAAGLGLPIYRDYSSAFTSFTQAAMSVSGMSPAQIQKFIDDHEAPLITFGVKFYRDQEAANSEKEKQDDADANAESLGMGTGFAVLYAIYYNFLANRTPEDLRDFLKNRQVKHPTKFAKALRRIFDDMATGSDGG